jgi:hypothetical protein
MTAIIRQIDIGPKKPVVDLSAPLAFAMFGASGLVADHSPWTATYLGRTLPDGKIEGVIRA